MRGYVSDLAALLPNGRIVEIPRVAHTLVYTSQPNWRMYAVLFWERAEMTARGARGHKYSIPELAEARTFFTSNQLKLGAESPKDLDQRSWWTFLVYQPCVPSNE